LGYVPRISVEYLRLLFNPFKIFKMKPGSLVICIDEDFPCIISGNLDLIGEAPLCHPWINGIFEVEDVLGEFITIDMFNSPEGINWWLSEHFRELNGDEIIEYQNRKKEAEYKNLEFSRILKEEIV